MEEELKKRIDDLRERADGIYGNKDYRDEIEEKIEFLEKLKEALYGR